MTQDSIRVMSFEIVLYWRTWRGIEEVEVF